MQLKCQIQVWYKMPLMAKNEAIIDTEVEFSWVSDVHPQNQTKFKLGY